MKIKIKKIITVEQDCYFSGLTLLSKEEYFKNKDHIKLINDWWWLRSPENHGYGVHRVNSDGSIDYFGICSTFGSVRPALVLDSANLYVGDKFKLYEHNWTMISERYALCDEPFCSMAFRRYWPAKNANIYDASDIKIYLDNEWNRMKDGEYRCVFETFDNEE